MVLDPARKPSAAFPAELLGGDDSWVPAAAAACPDADSPRAPPWVPAAAAAPRREALEPLAEHPGSDRRVSWSPGAADVESEQEDDVAWSDDAASDDDDYAEDDVTRACLELLRGGRATRWRSARAAFLALRLRPASASGVLAYARHAIRRRRARRTKRHAAVFEEGLPRLICGGPRRERSSKARARAGQR